ncbi:MAG: hypothetical protein IK088_08660 [Lachnospiraceae bacterium]|nr:hypothetical protein [Lachnospiraceae bacterium]
MISVTIENTGHFMNAMLKDDTFDRFLCINAFFKTSFQTEINARSDVSPVYYKDIRPVAFDLLKGSRLPDYFRIVLTTDRESTDRAVEKAGFEDCPVNSLVLNVTFQNGTLTLSTGVSYGGFSLDKKIESYWDQSVLHFLEKREVRFA